VMYKKTQHQVILKVDWEKKIETNKISTYIYNDLYENETKL